MEKKFQQFINGLICFEVFCNSVARLFHDWLFFLLFEIFSLIFDNLVARETITSAYYKTHYGPS